jgi:hypothetical protein
VWANPTADFGHGTGLPIELGGLQKFPMLDQPHGVRDIDMSRAGFVTRGRVWTVNTPGSLTFCPFKIQWKHDFFKVLNALCHGANRQPNKWQSHTGFAVNCREIALDFGHKKYTRMIPEKMWIFTSRSCTLQFARKNL